MAVVNIYNIEMLIYRAVVLDLRVGVDIVAQLVVDDDDGDIDDAQRPRAGARRSSSRRD